WRALFKFANAAIRPGKPRPAGTELFRGSLKKFLHIPAAGLLVVLLLVSPGQPRFYQLFGQALPTQGKGHIGAGKINIRTRHYIFQHAFVTVFIQHKTLLFGLMFNHISGSSECFNESGAALTAAATAAGRPELIHPYSVHRRWRKTQTGNGAAAASRRDADGYWRRPRPVWVSV